jgi:hypothetical protein
MRKTAIYQKSAKGLEAIGSRQHGLGPKLRSTLILVDGKRGFEELARLSAALGEAEQLLGQLLAEGFIEEASASLAAAAPPAALARDAGAPTATLSLPQAQRFAVRRLTDVLGPTAEELCMRIESARNLQEFSIAVTRAEQIVREFRGAETAAAFAAEMQSHRPG